MSIYFFRFLRLPFYFILMIYKIYLNITNYNIFKHLNFILTDLTHNIRIIITVISRMF